MGLWATLINREFSIHLPENNSGKFYYRLNAWNPHKALIRSANYSFWSNEVLLCRREWRTNIYVKNKKKSSIFTLQHTTWTQVSYNVYLKYWAWKLILSGLSQFSWKSNQLLHLHYDQSKNSCTVTLWVTWDQVSPPVWIVLSAGKPHLSYLICIQCDNGNHYDLKFPRPNCWNN